MTNFSGNAFVPQPFNEKFASRTRRHQGIPGIEILPSGRLFATWYTGENPYEGPGNYAVLATSVDGGRSWREIQVVAPIDPAVGRAFDPALWLDPAGRLWWFWAQANSEGAWKIYDGRAGVWAAVCDAPDTDSPAWGAPRRLSDGIMMNKPTLLADGSWALPVSIWSVYPDKIMPELEHIAKANILWSGDHGRTFEMLPGARISDPARRSFDEHMLIERRDGSWWMLIRGNNPGIWESVSTDRGKSWSEPAPAVFDGPCSRFAIRRLKSGRLALVNHRIPHRLPGETHIEGMCRNNLTAWLSDDDGQTWSGGLPIDARSQVSYPDLAEGADGFLYLAYDHARLEHGQVLMARFSEDDIRAGALVTPGSCLNLLISAFAACKE